MLGLWQLFSLFYRILLTKNIGFGQMKTKPTGVDLKLNAQHLAVSDYQAPG